MDLGGSVSRTAWMIGGGLLALVLLLLLLSSGFRVWFGGAMFVLGALLTIGGSIWLLVEAARTSVLWLVLFLFVPFANLAFVIVHWSTAKRPFITELVGVGMLILGAVLFAAGISGSRKRCDSEKFDSRGRGAPGRISKSSRVNDDVDEPRVRPRRRPVRWRAVGGFSCAGVQDRIDDCEDEWVDQLERMLKRRSYPPGVMRISVDRPQTAVKQAQTLAFDSGELHRCQVAQRRQLPIESEWLKGLGGCFARKQCKAFSACHTKVFLRYVGQLPFSCRFYCNKELYQCAAEVVGSTLADQRGYKGVPDEDRLDRVRPKLFARCLRFCKKKIKTHKTREAMVQCVFQPTCKAFVECVKPIPMD